LSKDNVIASQQVEIGLSNDIYTEIISGLQEGDKVITNQTTGLSGSNSASSNIKPNNDSNKQYGGEMNIMRMMRSKL